MDKLGLKLLELLRRGADPRRADHNRRRAGDEVSAAVHLRALNESAKGNLRVGLILGSLVGVITTVLIITVTGVALGLRPAPVGDVDMVHRLRAALPHPESLSANELAQRLALPPEVGRMVASLVDVDQVAPSPEGAAFSALSGQIGLYVDQHRLAALVGLADRLGAITREQRAEELDALLELERALRDPGAAAILRAIGSLSQTDRRSLSQLKV